MMKQHKNQVNEFLWISSKLAGIHKRYSYGTVMVDLESHCIIDIINSRETKRVEERLRSFPNLQVISRSGAQDICFCLNQRTLNITVRRSSSAFFRYPNLLSTSVWPPARACCYVHTWFSLPFLIYCLFLQQIRSIMDWLPNFP